ncbi:hypothetical protein ACFT9I_00865 [Streptomyces sp. NPDC057137]|uniref:hypothetical protein n=1 Tax=Streptomyces sp. NPDC057137 TaxID=3346030 RepID=UPI003637F24D
MSDPTGLWRAHLGDGRYREVLIHDDGTGWTESGRRSSFECITEFTWVLTEPDRMEFTYGECREVEDGRVSHTWPAQEHSAHRFTVGERADPDGPVFVLTLDQNLLGAVEFTRKAVPGRRTG